MRLRALSHALTNQPRTRQISIPVTKKGELPEKCVKTGRENENEIVHVWKEIFIAEEWNFKILINDNKNSKRTTLFPSNMA